MGHPSGLFPSGLPTKTLYTPLSTPSVLHAPSISFFSITLHLQTRKPMAQDMRFPQRSFREFRSTAIKHGVAVWFQTYSTERVAFIFNGQKVPLLERNTNQRRRNCVPPKRRQPLTQWHSVTTQNTWIIKWKINASKETP
jgi:hypothetical protein